MSDRDIFLIEIGRRGRDAAGTPVDYATLRADVADLQDRPAILKLVDIPDVSGSPTNGQLIAWDADTEQWIFRSPPSGITVNDGDDMVANVWGISFDNGLVSAESTVLPGFMGVGVRFGGTGTSPEVARRDHRHTVPTIMRVPFGPAAYMSSGSRTLASTSVTLLSGVTYLVKTKINMQMRGADPGACYYRLNLTIDGNSRQSAGGSAGFWCVQGVPDKTTWNHSRQITGTGAAIPISAAVSYFDGGGFYTDAGELEIELLPSQ